MKQAVQVVGPVRRPANHRMKGIFVSGETIDLTMKNLFPQHDSSLGVFFVEAAPVEGRRWKPLVGARLTKSGEYARTPGWLELLDPNDEPPEE